MIRNVAEDHVTASYHALLPHFPNFCGCDMCRDDVFVFTLNRIPPRYASSPTGSVVTELNLERDQSRAPIDVAVMEALQRIAAAPRCGRSRKEVPPAG